VVAISPAIRDAAPDLALGIPPPPCLWGHTYCRWIVAAAAGIVCLSYVAYGWAAFFLIIAALNLAAGHWELTISRSPFSRSDPAGQ
jgi:hypothetical protein